MNDPTRSYVSHDRILVEAGELLSDHGGADANDIQRDDAIVTLVTRLLGRDDDARNRAAVRTLIIQHNARRPEGPNPDAVWANLSPAAKASWVRTMMPPPPGDAWYCDECGELMDEATRNVPDSGHHGNCSLWQRDPSADWEIEEQA